MILLLDDDPVQRLIAERDLRKITKRLLIPQRAIEIASVDISPVKLVIADRWLGEAWSEQVEKIVSRLPNEVPIWEWTCDEWGQSKLPRVERVIYKKPGALAEAIKQWVNG